MNYDSLMGQILRQLGINNVPWENAPGQRTGQSPAAWGGAATPVAQPGGAGAPSILGGLGGYGSGSGMRMGINPLAQWGAKGGWGGDSGYGHGYYGAGQGGGLAGFGAGQGGGYAAPFTQRPQQTIRNF